MRTAGDERIAIASRSVTVSAPVRAESPTTTVARSGDDPLTSSTGPSRASHVVVAGAPEVPMVAGRSGTDESIAGVLRRFSHAATSHTRASVIARSRGCDALTVEWGRRMWCIDRNLDRSIDQSMRRCRYTLRHPTYPAI